MKFYKLWHNADYIGILLTNEDLENNKNMARTGHITYHLPNYENPAEPFSIRFYIKRDFWDSKNNHTIDELYVECLNVEDIFRFANFAFIPVPWLPIKKDTSK